jgi:hypothetical protein
MVAMAVLEMEILTVYLVVVVVVAVHLAQMVSMHPLALVVMAELGTFG